MKITDIVLFENLLLEYRESKVQGILNNKNKMDKLAGATQQDNSADNFVTIEPSNNQSLKHPAEPVLRKLAEYDPTNNSMYLNWLVDRYGQGDFRLEDQQRIEDTLKNFHKYKNLLNKKDINEYDGISDINQAVKPLVQADEDPSERQKRLRTKRGEYKEGEVKTIINSSNLKVEQPLSQAAMNHICSQEGEEVEWCTVTGKGERFDQYNSDGNIYQITAFPGTNRVRKFLVHVESKQFMDENDKPIKQDDIDMLSSIPEYAKFLNMLIKNNHLSHSQFMYTKHNDPESLANFEKLLEMPELLWEIFKHDKNKLREYKDVWATDATTSYEYANRVIGGRFKKGENAIATEPQYAYFYARDFPEARKVKKIEDAILSNPQTAFMYRENVLKQGLLDKAKSLWKKK